MADVTWPYHLAEIIIDGATIAHDENVLRTEFESGLVAQKRTTSKAMFVRTVTIRVLHSNYVEFRAWLEDHAHTWFNFRDAFVGDDLLHDVRVRGGAGAVELERSNDFAVVTEGPGGVTLDTPLGARYWTGIVTFEGFV